MNSSHFYLFGYVLISYSFLKESFAEYKILFDSLFLPVLWVWHPTASSLHGFWWEIVLRIPRMWCVTLLLLLSRFNLCFFDGVVIMCVSKDLFEFFLLGICGISWICTLSFVIKYEKFLVVISSNIFSVIFFFSHPAVQLMAYHRSFFFIVSAYSSDWIISIDLPSNALFSLLFAHICCWVLLVNVFIFVIALINTRISISFLKKLFLCFYWYSLFG